jgi:hypothetical protein
VEREEKSSLNLRQCGEGAGNRGGAGVVWPCGCLAPPGGAFVWPGPASATGSGGKDLDPGYVYFH